jgi:hypothetical protein
MLAVISDRMGFHHNGFETFEGIPQSGAIIACVWLNIAIKWGLAVNLLVTALPSKPNGRALLDDIAVSVKPDFSGKLQE